jgi:hypothetical protein
MLRVGKFSVLVLLGLLSLLGTASNAQEILSPRLQIGTNLLPAVIAANTGLEEDNGTDALPIYLVYHENQRNADQLVPNLGRVGMIRKRVLKIQPIALDKLLEQEVPAPSVVFITEPLDQRLQSLVEFSQAQRVLLFSPFKGDVERGVTTGFRVTDRVLPMVNMTSLEQSKIQLKAFFLRIAVKHE